MPRSVGDRAGDQERGLQGRRPRTRPQSAGMHAVTAPYLCNQCGPDGRGEDIHRATRHCWPPAPADITEEAAREYLLGDVDDEPAAGSTPPTEPSADLRSVAALLW